MEANVAFLTVRNEFVDTLYFPFHVVLFLSYLVSPELTLNRLRLSTPRYHGCPSRWGKDCPYIKDKNTFTVCANAHCEKKLFKRRLSEKDPAYIKHFDDMSGRSVLSRFGCLVYKSYDCRQHYKARLFIYFIFIFMSSTTRQILLYAL